MKNTLRQLQDLAANPDQQAEAAVALLRPGDRHDVLLAAMQVLAEQPSDLAHDALLSVYQYLAIDGVKRDAGTYVRSAALKALRRIVRQDDEQMLLEAVATYEYLPPEFNEDAGQLRAAALLALNELDHESTSYHAARLLVDGRHATMSGEPAVSAVRVLASRGEFVPLYLFVMKTDGGQIEEASAECLRSLVTLPTTLISGVIESVVNRASPVELLGLFDLLINHEAGPQGASFLRDYLSQPSDPDVFRYLIITALMARHDDLTSLICDAAQDTMGEVLQDILVEAMLPFATDNRVEETLARIADR